jgi:hypothetical protein
MNCYSSGLFGIAMLSATFFTMTACKDQHNELTKKLSPEVNDIYINIVNERRNLYIQGIIIGIIVSYSLLQYFPITNQFHKLSFAVGITGVVSVLYYFLMPKSDYMLNHLKTPEEIKAWLEVYKTMRYRYFIGFVFGLLSAIPLTSSLC